MKTILKKLLPLMVLALLTSPAKGQIGDNEPSQSLLAVQCAMSSGYPATGYEEYCRRLAKTVAFLSPVQQERVFGYVPQPHSADDQDVYVTPHYGQSEGTNYESNNGGTDGVIFHGDDDISSGDTQQIEAEGDSSGNSGDNWWGHFFDWLNGIVGDKGVDPSEMGAWVDEYNGAFGDGNNGHGDDPGGVDSSNPGRGNKPE